MLLVGLKLMLYFYNRQAIIAILTHERKCDVHTHTQIYFHNCFCMPESSVQFTVSLFIISVNV